MHYIAILRYGVNKGHEYEFARTRRENGAIKEVEKMVDITIENMAEHANGGRVVSGSHPTDPNAVLLALILTDGQVIYKTVTYRPERPTVRSPTEDRELSDALAASLLARSWGSL